jgi:hypothetical protein
VTPSITQADVNKALGAFLRTILGFPNGQVIVGQANRVSSPEGDYVVMWPLRRPRLATNVDTSADAKFTGSIAGMVMTITDAITGEMSKGATVFGIGVAASTTVTAQVGGTPGGAGIYAVSPSQTVASTTLSAGATEIEQATEIVMQVDVHGPGSSDNAQTISTLFRDEYAVTQFDGTGITPLYADEPRQMPFLTAAHQYEDRWTVDVHMQADPVIAVPQEFADAVEIIVIDIDTIVPAVTGTASLDFSDPANSQFLPGLI